MAGLWKKSLELAATGLLAGTLGCGDEGGGAPSVSSSKAKVTVAGTVKVKGKPAGGGTIVFDPANIKRKMELPRTATIGNDGTYQVETLAGDNSVRVQGPPVNAAKLSAFTTSFDAKEGSNTFDVELAP